MWSYRLLGGLFASLALAVVLTGLSTAQTFTTIHTFTGGDGSQPDAVLVQGRDGFLYGTTSIGGTGTCATYYSGCGTVFKIDTAGNLTTLHNFIGSDGNSPQGLILVRDGNFYGIATLGGANGFGVLYRITKDGVFTVLHDFTNGEDGQSPSNQLLEANNGNLYGFTPTGLYQYTPAGVVTTLYTFPNYPVYGITAPLIQADDGSLYATLPYAPISTGSSCGSIIKFTLQGAILSRHDFGCYKYQVGGTFPQSAVVETADGNLYGTDLGGGIYSFGAVFKLDGKTGIITDLHDFDLYGQQGDIVSAGLALGTDGNFYGVAADGGAFPYPGVIFQITSDGTYTVFLTIPDHQEDWPLFSLRQHTNGRFYSVSRDGGGTTYYGTVYSFDNNLGAFVTFVRPQGHVGAVAQILGQGLTGSTSVTFNGVPATSFSVVSDTYMTAVVPSGASTGPVIVTTPSGPLTSNVNFRISK